MLTDRKLFLQFERSAMYKMEINVSGQQRIFLFRGPGCRRAMLKWWRDQLHRAASGEGIRNIRVWGTVGNKTDIVLEWPRAMASRTGRARSQQRPRNERRPGW